MCLREDISKNFPNVLWPQFEILVVLRGGLDRFRRDQLVDIELHRLALRLQLGIGPVFRRAGFQPPVEVSDGVSEFFSGAL